MPCGVPRIVGTFNIDANKNLNVAAQDKSIGRSSHITIMSRLFRKDEFPVEC